MTELAQTPKDLFNSICTSIDKLDKEPWAAVEEELREKGVNKDQIGRLADFVIGLREEQSFEGVLAELSQMLSQVSSGEVLDEMRSLRSYLESMGVADLIKIDTSLARGLDYYTGLIFEAVISGGEEAQLGLGSIAAGGRYDNLIGMFSKVPIPSAGGSLGIERIFNILEARAEKEHSIINPMDAVVGQIGTSVPRTVLMRIASWLWDNGFKTDIWYEGPQKVGE